MMFVEVLDRGADVRSRSRIASTPFTIGRAYDNDLILDDPYVAPHHLRVERDANGGLLITDLGSKNGLHLLDPPRQATSVAVSQDLRVRIGHTQLRFRDAHFAVEPELATRPGSQLLRRAIAFYLVLIATGLLLFGEIYLSTFDEARPVQMVASVLALLLGAFAWIGTWAFFGRLATRNANFYAHANTALIGVTAIVLGYEVSSHLAYALSSEIVPRLFLLVLVAILAAMLYRHIRLVSRAPVRRAAITAAALSGALVGSIWLADYAARLTYATTPEFAPQLKPPAFRMVPPDTPEAFVAKANGLREEIDRLLKAK